MKKDPVAAARILLVDDNLQGLTVSRKMILADHGYDVETALSGEEAWEIFQKSRFDVVVTDLRMGGIDGLELIRRIRAADAPVRTILLSGFIDCLGMTAETSGADELINKSNKEVPELLRAIRKLAAHPRRQKLAPGHSPVPAAAIRAQAKERCQAPTSAGTACINRGTDVDVSAGIYDKCFRGASPHQRKKSC